MENLDIKYFLATNSCEGFISSFKDCYDAKDGWRAYIIKGGPGTGKSSFMKYIAVKAAEKNIKCELCPCSSDPDSLDAVILPEKKTVIMDGTAPHTVDPVYPAACEQILDFGSFWNSEKISQKNKDIISVTDKNKSLHRSASRYLKACGNLMLENYKTQKSFTDTAKVYDYALKLCRKNIPESKKSGKEWVRYLCGTTPKGVVSYTNTIIKTCKKIIIIKDEYGSVGNIIMNTVREKALENGYEIITVKNAFLPSVITDHIIIPELSLAFVRESEFQHFAVSYRRIRAERFIDTANLSKRRERMKFNKKAVRELLISAAAVLSEAKSVHDKLEKYYIDAMDFPALTEFATKFSEKIF